MSFDDYFFLYFFTPPINRPPLTLLHQVTSPDSMPDHALKDQYWM